ncbi:unnamed protein product [Strongylus vulgaris]|uniref:Uncharacterized protein n=1 Tax=Strongylus vulgaris TaxID=40348 RepID=A0A3P7IXP2_STRVU|nr:unnamed protein product [Strongylus vulgaris]
MFGGGALWKFQHQIKCKLFECCDKPYVNPRFDSELVLFYYFQLPSNKDVHIQLLLCSKLHVGNFLELHQDLYKLVYGQHLVLDTVENAIRAHWTNEKPKKPLAMSFHGFTGSGKNYVAEIVANSTFK